jgi:hypothetical protein
MNLEQVVFVPKTHPTMDALYATKKLVTMLDIARAMDNMIGVARECVLLSDNRLYRAITMLRMDYDKHVSKTEFVDANTMIYGIAGDHRQPVIACNENKQSIMFIKPIHCDHGHALKSSNAVFFDDNRAIVF